MFTKEEQKKKRRQAYLNAKAKRDSDPSFIALKAKQKEERARSYRAFKEEQKKTKQKIKEEARHHKDIALLAFLKTASSLDKKDGDQEKEGSHLFLIKS